MLVEEGSGADKVECDSVWSSHRMLAGVAYVFHAEWGDAGHGRFARKTYIFIASNCSFLGMISSIYGANKG